EAGNAGIIVCAAAGNGGDDSIGDDNSQTPEYPASYNLPNLISVAASNLDDELADFSNYGTNSVDIAAPGVEIESTALTGRGDGSAYVEADGTVFRANDMEYSGHTDGITKTIYYCGRGLSAGDFPAAVNGNIALIERGIITFAEKVTNARNAGALAAIIYNNIDGGFLGTLGEDLNWIPTLSMSRENGLLLRNMGNPVITLENKTSNYQFSNGTSFSTAFVCGAIGLLASRFPQDNSDMRVTRLLLASDSLPSLQNSIRSGRRLNIGSPEIKAPQNLQASRVINQSLFQREYINILTWQANSGNQSYNITGYRVYRVNGKELEVIAEVDANQLEYMHRNAGEEGLYTYAVVAVAANGSTGEP
ncbi:MAG: S8 family serine peptidase, partial [Planctomycetes bacterium]|nr:S8 family serine peptidase [Planctomycetota bacterium]